MRWLKHLTDAHADEKMAMLRAEAGFEGYGFYWFILERIAKQIDGDDGKTSLTYPIKFWSSLAGVSTRVLKRLAETCAKLDLFSVKFSGNLMTIDCPNILKYRDEWTKKKVRNSGATPERLRSKDTDTDTEGDKKKPSVSFVEDAPAFRLARYLFNCIRKNKPDFKQPNLQVWARDMDLMIRIDKRDPDEMREVIKWCQEDNAPDDRGFCWAHNVLSAAKLRKQFDQLAIRMNSREKEEPF